MRTFHAVRKRDNAHRRNCISAMRTHSSGQSSPHKSTPRYRNERRRKSAESCGQREFHAATYRVDAIGADTHTITQLPDARVSAATAGDDGMVALAVHARGPGLFCQAISRHEPLYA